MRRSRAGTEAFWEQVEVWNGISQSGNPAIISQDGVGVTHLAHDQKIAGSNPAPAPKIIK